MDMEVVGHGGQVAGDFREDVFGGAMTTAIPPWWSLLIAVLAEFVEDEQAEL